MTDLSLMIPTIAISFFVFLLVLAVMNQGKAKTTSSSRKYSQAVDDFYLFSTSIYDDTHHHSSGADHSGGVDFGGGHFGGDCGGFDGGSH